MLAGSLPPSVSSRRSFHSLSNRCGGRTGRSNGDGWGRGRRTRDSSQTRSNRPRPRDFVSVRTARRCLIFSARARSSRKKKTPRLHAYAKRGASFSRIARRLKRARALFPPREGVRLILGFLTSKWMRRSIIGREDQKEIFTFLHECSMHIWKCVLNFLVDFLTKLWRSINLWFF